MTIISYILLSLLVLSIGFSWILVQVAKRIHNELLDELEDTTRRELYLMKAINDAMDVVDVRGFIYQRMKNAPEDFEPLDEEDVKPDKISS